MGEISSSNPHLLVNQTYVPTPIEWQYVNNPGIMLGPWMLGALLDFMFAGILLQQFYFYRTHFKDDALYIKVIVWITMLFATLKTVQAFLIVWFKVIIAYGDWREAASWPWQDWSEPILGASLGAASQTYFSIRCYRLSGRKTWLLLCLFFFMFISWGCSFGVGLQIGLSDPYADGKIPYAVIPMLVTTVAVDSVITFVTLFYLLQPKKGFNPQTDTIVGRLVVITFEAALPPALSALCDMVTSITEIGNLHATFNMLTPRLYAFSLLFTLNVRLITRELALGGNDHISIQPAGSNDVTSHCADVAASARPWFNRKKPKSQVHVETETVTIRSERAANSIILSPDLEGSREAAKTKELEVSSISTTWVAAESTLYEMGSLGYSRSKGDSAQEGDSNIAIPHGW